MVDRLIWHFSEERMTNNLENTFRILVATDCHLGYKERDPVRSKDSLNTFEEILKHADSHKVDMILLGGDLFHENKPSRNTLHSCMELLRKYCKGNRPVNFEYITDSDVDFSANQFPVVDYAGPNGGIPVFSIHGNHDNPAGLGGLCALDVLSVAGLVNYFGKSPSLDDACFKISPVLLKKGRTKLALYGLGFTRDERLHQMFRDNKISLQQPRENRKSFFNLFVLHQNRAENRGEHNHIPEKFLSDCSCIDLVIWGHEHDCQLEHFKKNLKKDAKIRIMQPGSSIATSLIFGESKQKHVALLEITDKHMELKEIPLETVRPLYFEEICLKSLLQLEDANDEEKIEALCATKIEKLVAKAAEHHSNQDHTNLRRPSPPLVRLRVDNSGGFSTFNMTRFGQKFVDEVANPQDIILFHAKKEAATGKEEGW